jgi:putative GTP pyrophosphokinase
MDNDTCAAILKEYDSTSPLYGDFARECEVLVRRLLAVKGYRIHTVGSRLKERMKVEEKLRREGKEYQKLSDMTDIAGIRVITHFDDEVDRIGTLVEAEFGIDREHSVDKRQLLEADRFGYLSLHYVCGLSDHRLKLSEYGRYAGLLCEIQIRTILQHAWAEIEHDLGYKPGSTVPKPIRRRFSRLAGLLEIGDQEFKSIRDELKKYEARVPDEIKAKPAQVEIDDVSLRAYMRGDSQYLDLVNAMAAVFALTVKPFTGDLKRRATELRSVGLTTIDELRHAVAAQRDIVLCQFGKREKVKAAATKGAALHDAVAVMNLVQVLVAKKGGADALLEHFSRFGYTTRGGSNEEAAREIFSAIESCTKGT